MRVKFITLLLFVLFSDTSVFAQSDSGWNPIGLTVDGKNIHNGIEAFYQLGKCNNEDVVFIKFINHNKNIVKVEWNDAVFTKELKWVNNENGDSKKYLTIGSNEIITGNCTDLNHRELIVKVHEFIKNTDEFKMFKATFFHVTINKK